MTDSGWIPADLIAMAEAGDGEAAHRLALLNAIGLNMPHDPVSAMDWLRRAAQAGQALAIGSLAVLETEPGGLIHDVAPPPPRRVSERPHVLIADGFVSPQVCDWLIARAAPGLAPAEIYDDRTGQGRPDPVRTNTTMAFDLAATDIVLVLARERMARMAGLPVSGLEPTQILRYRPGQAFDWHHDYLDPAVPGHRGDLARRGQRIATGLIWLNDDYEGGDTAFSVGDLRFRGQRGDAILWANTLPQGGPDPTSRHAGLAPTRGEKWVLSQWMRPFVVRP